MATGSDEKSGVARPVPTGDAGAPVLVTGASGFVGSHIVRLLAGRGRRVRALLRPTSSDEAVRGLPIEIVYGDVLDPPSLEAAMQGVSSVFHCVVDPRFWLTDQTPIYRNNVEGLVNAMDAALASGVGRFIFISTMGTLGLNPDGPVDEEIPFNWFDRAPPYIRARLAAEERFLAYCREKALPGVALCVANTYGPQDYQPTPHNGALWQIACGALKVVVDVAQPTVDIRDVAESALLAECRGRTGERYIIANAFVTNRDFFAIAVARLGTAAPTFIPYRLALALASIAELCMKLFRCRDYVVSADAIYLSNIFGDMDTRKARSELGWSPRPLRDTVHDAVDWFQQREASAKAAPMPRDWVSP